MSMTLEECQAREELPNQGPEAIRQVGGRRVIYATYAGDVRTIDGDRYYTFTLPEAIARATRPGDLVQVLDGKYWPPMEPGAGDKGEPTPRSIDIVGRRGEPDRPITIRGLGAATVLCGSNAAVPLYPHLPGASDFAFFRLLDCTGVEIEDFQVESCWPCFVYAEDSSYVTVRRIAAIDAQYLIFARGPGCHHFLIEDVDWCQDPSGALWRHLEFNDVHGHPKLDADGNPIKDEEGNYIYVGPYRYLNGGLFGSNEIAGSVVIRGNSIRDAYNGIRLDTDGKQGPVVGRRNLNVEIHDNLFERLCDNAIEPEGAATNWMIRHNRIHNVHAWFSLDGVGGGFWYIFGNLGWFDDRPGQPHHRNTGGKVFKFHRKGPFPELPAWVFNNSWFLRIFLTKKKGYIKNFKHLNNAIQFCATEAFPDCMCKPDRQLVQDGFPVTPKKKPAPWDATVVFDHDLSTKPFGELRDKHDQEANGHHDPCFRFADPTAGDLRPAPETPLPKGADITLKARVDWPGAYDWTSAAGGGGPPTIGAFQDEEPMEGPPFVFLESDQAPEGYVERPRVVRVERRDPARLTVHFSAPLAGEGPVTLTLREPGRPWVSAEIDATIADTRLTANLGAEWTGPPVANALILLPPGLVGANGQPLTLWASADARIGIGET